MAILYRYSTGQRVQYFSENKYSAVLAANVEDTLTVPYGNSNGTTMASTSGEWVAEIVVNDASNVWMSLNATAVIPTTTFGSTNSELIPIRKIFRKIVVAGQVLHFITDDANTQISVKFYQNQ